MKSGNENNVELITRYEKYLVGGFNHVRGIVDQQKIVLSSRGDLQDVMMIALELYHFREALPSEHAIAETDLIAQCTDFALLSDTVNSWKHTGIHSTWGDRTRLISRRERILEALVVNVRTDNSGPTSAHKSIYVVLDDGTQRDFLEVLVNVLNFWERYMASRGLINSNRTFVARGNTELA